MKRKGEKRVGQNRPKIKKTTYFVLAMICLTIICISPIFIGKWLIQRQASAEPEYDEPEACTCNGVFPTLLTYSGKAQNPKDDTNVKAIYGTDFETYNSDGSVKTAGIAFVDIILEFADENAFVARVYNESTGEYVDSPITQTSVDFIEVLSEDSDVPVSFKNQILWNWAGKYTFKIVDNVTGQVICPNHTLVIQQATVTLDAVTLVPTTTGISSPYYYGETLKGETSWSTPVSGVSGNLTVSATAQGSGSAAEFSYAAPYSVSYETIASKAGTTVARAKNNFANTEKSVSFQVKAAAVFGSTYYASIDDAIGAANTASAGGTVVVLPSYSDAQTSGTAGYGVNDIANAYTLETDRRAAGKTINRTTTIDSNVTLIIPWGSTTGDDKVNVHSYREAVKDDNGNVTGYNLEDASFIRTDASGAAFEDGNTNAYLNESKYCTNVVTLNTTMTLNGKLYISGKYHAAVNAQISGHTYSYHGKMTLGTNGSLSAESGSTVTIFGFIDGCDAYTDIVFKSGSNLLMPFVFLDWRSGSVTLAMRNGYQAADDFINSPIVRYIFPNISGKYTINAGASAKAKASIYMPTSEKEIEQDALVISSSGALVNLQSGSSLQIHYDNTNKKDSRFGTMNLDFYGNASINIFSLTLNVKDMFGDLIGSVGGLAGVPDQITLSSVNKFLPLSYFYNIGVHNGTLNTENQKIKMLPGSSLTVYPGATVKGSELLIYEKNPHVGRAAYGSFPSNLPAVDIDVQGTLIMNVLAGKVSATTDGGKLQVLTGTTASDYDLLPNSTGSVKSTSFDLMGAMSDTVYYSQTTNSLSLPKQTDASSTYSSKGTYYSALRADDETYGWYSSNMVVNFNPTGGTFADGSTAVYSISPASTTYNGLITPPTNPTLSYYTFSHWCTTNNCKNGDSCSNKIDFTTDKFFADTTTLYAAWKANTYTINYNYDATGITPGDTDVLTKIDSQEFTVESTFTLYAPTYGNSTTNKWFVFGGWYLDANYTEQIVSIKDDRVTDYLSSDGDLELYGKWWPVGTKFYNLIFINEENVDIENNFTATSTLSYVGENIANATLLNWATQNNNPEYEKYFTCWYFTDANGNTVNCLDDAGNMTNKLTDAVGVTNDEGVIEFTLYADWGTKATVTFDYGTDDPNGFTDPSPIWVVPGSTVTISQFATKDLTTLDDDVKISKYFGGWTATNATISDDGAKVTISAGATTATVTAQWSTKHKITSSLTTRSGATTTLKVTVNGVDEITNESTEIWVKPTDTVVISASAKGFATGSGLSWSYYGSTVTVKNGESNLYSTSYMTRGAFGRGGNFGNTNSTTITLTQAQMENNSTTTVTVTIAQI